MYNNYNFSEEDLFAIYLRKSQADDPNEAIEVTLSKHKNRLIEVMKRYNIKEEQVVFYEEVVSGDTIAERPQMKKLLNDVNNNLYKGVFVVAVDRFSRGDSIDQGIVNNSFYYSDTLIITPDKIFDIANNDFDREQLEFGLFISKREYNLIKKRMFNGRMDNAKQGYFVGSECPYGYTKKISEQKKGYILVPHDVEADILKSMFQKTKDGMGTTELANYLNSINAPTKVSKQWTPAMVRSILKNPVYYGMIRFNHYKSIKKIENGIITKKRVKQEDCIFIKGKHEPLISKELFDEVQQVMKSNSVKKVKNNYTFKNPLAGIIKCGYCHEHYDVERNLFRRPYKNGRQETLLCQYSKCKNVASDLNIVEDKIIDGLKYILKQYKYYLDNYEREFIKEQDNFQNEIEYIKKELEKNKKQLNNAKKYYELEDYTREEYLERKNMLEPIILNLESKLNELKENNSNNKIIVIKEYIPKIEECILNYYKAKSVEEKNKLLKSIIKNIYYKKEKSGRWDLAARDNFELKFEMVFDKNIY